ncbi:MAG: hypothetical protein MUO21_12150, partial [Nitrososphaeraceae archaeon]|nr:hypothetical protein [Nitrososphaeraceae archaeon]
MSFKYSKKNESNKPSYDKLTSVLKLPYKSEKKDKDILKNNLFNKIHYDDGDDFNTFILSKCEKKYDLINELVEYLLFSERFYDGCSMSIFNKYIEMYVLDKSVRDQKAEFDIDELVIQYAIICEITNLRYSFYFSEEEESPQNNENPEVSFDEEEYKYIKTKHGEKAAILKAVVINKPLSKKKKSETRFYELIEQLIKDSIITGEHLFNLTVQYAKYEESHPILEMSLKLMKLTPYHLNELIKEYNGDLHILHNFALWGILPTEEQYNKLVQNGCLSDIEIMRKYNIPLGNEYILSSIQSGIYPIEGYPIKDKVKLSDNEKKRMNKYIFSHKFSKKDLANMQKQFGLVYDVECMLNFCKNDGS